MYIGGTNCYKSTDIVSIYGCHRQKDCPNRNDSRCCLKEFGDVEGERRSLCGMRSNERHSCRILASVLLSSVLRHDGEDENFALTAKDTSGSVAGRTPKHGLYIA